MKKYLLPLVLAFLAILIFNACKQPTQKEEKKIVVKQRKAPATKSYHFAKPKTWLATSRADFSDKRQRQIVLAVNRVDSSHFFQLDSVLIPNDLSGDIEFYLPFPFIVPSLSDIKKIIFFSYPAQAFGAYENGQLVYTGPTNMGRKHDPTPTGLFYTNWKAEQTTSTFNDEWNLKWNFNIENKLGVGWHEYAMPGYPASHSCMRLQEWDARYLYNWADQWVVDKNEKFELQGTPVVIFGTYNFDAAKPWLSLGANPGALTIGTSELEAIVAPHLADTRNWQEKRALAKK